MKSLPLVILFLCFVVGAGALTPNVRAHAPRKILASAGLATMMGTVQDGNKLRFATDQRAWNVMSSKCNVGQLSVKLRSASS